MLTRIMNRAKLTVIIDLNNLGAKVRLRFMNNSEIHPKLYIKFRTIVNPIKVRNIKYSPFPISISRTFNPIIFKLKNTVIKRNRLKRILLNSHQRMIWKRLLSSLFTLKIFDRNIFFDLLSFSRFQLITHNIKYKNSREEVSSSFLSFF